MFYNFKINKKTEIKKNKNKIIFQNDSKYSIIYFRTFAPY